MGALVVGYREMGSVSGVKVGLGLLRIGINTRHVIIVFYTMLEFNTSKTGILS